MKTIFNIFSQREHHKEKTTKTEERLKVIVDIHEKNSSVISELISLDLEVEFQPLKVGDYLVSGVCIERKTVSDFISSMISRRLLRQLGEMQQYENRLLIIEGIDEQELYLDGNPTGMNPNSVRGFLLSILLKHKVPIIFTKNAEDTAKFISVLARKKSSEEVSLNVKKKSLSSKEQMQFVLESFPGIGPKTARILLKKFGSVSKVINAPEEELKKLMGKKAESIIRIRDERY